MLTNNAQEEEIKRLVLDWDKNLAVAEIKFKPAIRLENPNVNYMAEVIAYSDTFEYKFTIINLTNGEINFNLDYWRTKNAHSYFNDEVFSTHGLDLTDKPINEVYSHTKIYDKLKATYLKDLQFLNMVIKYSERVFKDEIAMQNEFKFLEQDLVYIATINEHISCKILFVNDTINFVIKTNKQTFTLSNTFLNYDDNRKIPIEKIKDDIQDILELCYFFYNSLKDINNPYREYLDYMTTTDNFVANNYFLYPNFYDGSTDILNIYKKVHNGKHLNITLSYINNSHYLSGEAKTFTSCEEIAFEKPIDLFKYLENHFDIH